MFIGGGRHETQMKNSFQGDLNNENKFERFPRPTPSLPWSKTQSYFTCKGLCSWAPNLEVCS